MLDIRVEDGNVFLAGVFDASQVVTAEAVFDKVSDSTTVDFSDLEYISSAGLGVLLRTHKRLMGSAGGLKLINVNHHINDILAYSGFDRLFEIETAEDR